MNTIKLFTILNDFEKRKVEKLTERKVYAELELEFE